MPFNKLQNFFIKAGDVLNVANETTNASSKSLTGALEKAKKEAYDALCDSFNTRIVMQTISDLVTAFNVIERASLDPAEVRPVAEWITFMVNMFGLNGATPADSETIGWVGSSIPEAARPYVYPLSKLRDELRRKARSLTGITTDDLSSSQALASLPTAAADGREKNSDNSPSKPYADIVSGFTASVRSLSSSAQGADDQPQSLSRAVLGLCDRLRDVDLWERGIYLEDGTGPDEPALVRPVTRELRAARREREEREAAKQKAKEEREREAAAKAEKGRLSHLDMFRTSEFGAWDDEGLPVRDAEGKEVAKSRAKKLRKEWERQKKLHEAWLGGQK